MTFDAYWAAMFGVGVTACDVVGAYDLEATCADGRAVQWWIDREYDRLGPVRSSLDFEDRREARVWACGLILDVITAAAVRRLERGELI